MSSCDNSNIKQNYIVTNTNEFETLTACTGIWTSNIYGCSPITVQDQLKLNVISNDNTLNRILVIDDITGLIQYRDINSIISGTSGISDFTYDNENTFVITTEDNIEFSASINTLTVTNINVQNGLGTTSNIGDGGLNITGGLSASTISATTYLNLPIDVYVTGGTFNKISETLTLEKTDGNNVQITGFTDIYSTGFTFNPSTYDISLKRNDGVVFTQNLGILATDVTITGGSYNQLNGTITFINNTGGTFSVNGFITGFTDVQVTGFTYQNNTFTISDTSGNTFSTSIDVMTGLTINGVLSATTYQGLPLDVYVTGGTYFNGNLTFTNNSGVTFNVGGLYTGQTNYVNSLTTGIGLSANTTTGNINIINTDPDQVVVLNDGTNISVTGIYPNFTVGVTGITDLNTYTTGFTYQNNTFTIYDNSGNTFDASFGEVTGLTVNGDLYTTGTTFSNTISATTYQNLPNDLPPSGTTGQILAKIDNTDYNVEWIDNYTSQLKHEVKAGQSLTKGQVVYVSGADGTNMIISKASNVSEATSSKTMGLIDRNLSTNDKGFVITEGLLSGLNTNSANVGDPVWLGVDGNLIYGLVNKPFAPSHLVFIGIVTRKNINNGEIFVKVHNGFELDEIHDVQITGTTNDGDVLSYNSATSLWKPRTIPSISLGRTLYVSTSGNDSTAIVGSLAYTYLTLEAAKAASINGDLIYVFPGTYNVTTTDTEGLAKDGISYYFSPNCIINKSTAGDMFRANGFIYGFKVYGYGNFNKTNSAGSIFSTNNILVYGSITGVGSLVSGAGYTVGPKTTTGGSGSGFVVTVNSINGTGGITALSIANAGSTYKVGDVITINGGTTPATLTITSILTEFNTDADISFEANDLYNTISSSVFDIRSTARCNIKFNNLLSTNAGSGFFIDSSNVNVNMYSISITNSAAFRGTSGSLGGMASTNLTVNGYQISATVNSAYVIAISAGSTAYFNVNFINYSGTGGYALGGNAATVTLNVSSITSIFGQALSTIYLNGLCSNIVGALNLYGGMVSLISGISSGDIDTVYYGTRSNGAGVTITISGGNVRLEMQNQDTTTGFAISGGIVRLRGSWTNDDMGTSSDLTGGTLIIEGDYEYGGPFYLASRFYGINVAGGTLILKGTIRINSPSITAYYSLDASPIQFTSGKVIIDGGTLISNVPQATPIRATSANNSVTSIGNGVAGAGYTTGTKTTTTSGSGTGLTLSVTNANGITNTTIVSRGTNYVVGDTITVVGGSSPATFTITAVSQFKVYASGMNTNLVGNGGTLTGKKKKMKFTVVAVANTQLTLNDNLGSGNLTFIENNTVTYNTIPLLAQRMASLINASVTLQATATQDTPGTDTYFYVESDNQDLGFSLVSYINITEIGLIPGMYPLIPKVLGTIIEDTDIE